MADGAGLRKGSDFRIRLVITDADGPVNLTDREVIVEAKLGEDGNETISLSSTDGGDVVLGEWDVLGNGADTEGTAAEDLRLELTITGSPQVNANERPVVIPLREPYSDAER